MSAEVVAVHGGRDPSKPYDDLVKDLEELLEEAKRGDLIGMAYCTVRSNNDIGSGWAGAAGTKHQLSSGILCLSNRYAHALVDG